jgi:hypothetical protein
MKLLSISNPWKFTVVALVAATPSWTHLLVQGTNTELVQYCLPDDDDSFDIQDIYCEHISRSTGSPPRSRREFIFDEQNEFSIPISDELRNSLQHKDEL